jgi:Membrane carboxypeptidase (penicillin-binding protein)
VAPQSPEVLDPQQAQEPVAPANRNRLLNLQIGLLIVIGAGAILLVIAFSGYARLVDEKLRAGAFSGTADIYAASPPTLITNVSDKAREHRRIVRFDDIPKVLVNAVVSVEDKRFFRHEGFDGLRMLKAAYVDIRQGRKGQGASTLSMQLARTLLLSPDKNWKRKIAQVAMAVRLEQKLTKQQIFEYYCNQVYLGRLGTFSVHGFGAASRAYFGKDIHDLTLPEAATLAGLIQRPSYYNPFRNLDRLQERRNVVLLLMRQNGYIGDAEYQQARDSRVTLPRPACRSPVRPISSIWWPMSCKTCLATGIRPRGTKSIPLSM